MERFSESAQARIREWVRDILDKKGWSGHKLAREAQVSPSTIHRILQDDRFVTATRTIDKIVQATGAAAPEDIWRRATPPGPGLREPEAVYYGEKAPPETPASAHAAVWQLQSRALQLAGCLPGDLLTVDPGTAPRAGDIVCVQVIDPASGEAETLFRVYDKPYAMTAAADPQAQRKPLMIDDERVQVWGTVVRVERNTRE